MTVEFLDHFVKHDKAVLYIDHLNFVFEKYDINTTGRVCHFMAQILHESGNLEYSKEIASGRAYEGRKDLGNTVKGDGVRFKGRGLIQITGRFNYQELSEDLDVDFIKRPELLETPQYAALSAGWFWDKKKLNTQASLPDNAKLKAGNRLLSPIEFITLRVNGGFNGLEDRKKKYELLKAHS